MTCLLRIAQITFLAVLIYGAVEHEWQMSVHAAVQQQTKP